MSNTKLFIAPYGTEDWKELGDVYLPIKIITDELDSLSVKITCERAKVDGLLVEMERRLLEYYKHRKKRKTTYKTIRHDCAKRNGRK